MLLKPFLLFHARLRFAFLVRFRLLIIIQICHKFSNRKIHNKSVVNDINPIFCICLRTWLFYLYYFIKYWTNIEIIIIVEIFNWIICNSEQKIFQIPNDRDLPFSLEQEINLLNYFPIKYLKINLHSQLAYNWYIKTQMSTHIFLIKL